MSSPDNNDKAGVFDYTMLIIGAVILFLGLKLLFIGAISFLQEDVGGPEGAMPGLFAVIFGAVAFFYSLKKIVRSKKNDT